MGPWPGSGSAKCIVEASLLPPPSVLLPPSSLLAPSRFCFAARLTTMELTIRSTRDSALAWLSSPGSTMTSMVVARTSSGVTGSMLVASLTSRAVRRSASFIAGPSRLGQSGEVEESITLSGRRSDGSGATCCQPSSMTTKPGVMELPLKARKPCSMPSASTSK